MYDYQTERTVIFSDQGQRMFLNIRDHAEKLLNTSGAARLENIIAGAGGGDSWAMLACVDRLVELGELREIPQGKVSAQARIFVRG
jgi:hypothetical protein